MAKNPTTAPTAATSMDSFDAPAFPAARWGTSHPASIPAAPSRVITVKAAMPVASNPS
jgi:hypothetical protein